MAKKTKTKPTKTKNSGKRLYNWEKMKREFFMGDYLTLKDFLEEKGLNNYKNPKYNGWVRERIEFQKKLTEDAAKKAIQKEMDDTVEVRIRQARLARFLQAKGAEKLKNVKPDDLSVKDASKLVIDGMEQEREALGVNAKVTNNNTFNQLNIGGKTNFDKLIEGLDYEGVLRFIAEIKRERTKRTLPEGVDGGTGEVPDGEVV